MRLNLLLLRKAWIRARAWSQCMFFVRLLCFVACSLSCSSDAASPSEHTPTPAALPSKEITLSSDSGSDPDVRAQKALLSCMLAAKQRWVSHFTMTLVCGCDLASD